MSLVGRTCLKNVSEKLCSRQGTPDCPSYLCRTCRNGENSMLRAAKQKGPEACNHFVCHLVRLRSNLIILFLVLSLIIMFLFKLPVYIEAMELLQHQKLHNPEWYRKQLAGLSDDQFFRKGQIARVFNSLERFRQFKSAEGTVFKCKARFIQFLIREEGLTKQKAKKDGTQFVLTIPFPSALTSTVVRRVP